jgi:phage repressor protein C with HTH and peptisase S24 domain
MPAAVMPIDVSRTARESRATWSLLELSPSGAKPVPLGILLVDDATDRLTFRLLGSQDFDDLEEQEVDILDVLPADLEMKHREAGGRALLDSLEDSLSDFLRISERTAIAYTGDARRTVDRLFDEHVDSTVRPYVTHLPFYGLRAAATRFGEGMASEQEGWVRVPDGFRIEPEMFVATVVGRSMEPAIRDGSRCVFRPGVTGSRQGKRLLIEQFGETDFASRYTVKRYTSTKRFDPEGNWAHEEIRLEPLNPEFSAFTLSPDEFRVIAEFVAAIH